MGWGVACAGIYKGLRILDCNVEVFHPAMMPGHSDLQQAYLNEDLSEGDFDSLIEKITSDQSLRGDCLLGAVQRFSAWVLGQAEHGIPDVIHAHDWHGVLAAVALKKRYGVPVVLQMHSSQTERVGGFTKLGIRALEQWGVKHADSIIVVSEISAKSLASDYDVAASKIHVVHNAIDLSSTVPREPEELRTLLFVGRFFSQKSPELAVEVFRRVVLQYPQLRLIMVGRGELLRPMKELVDFYALQQNVELLGKVPIESMAVIYSRADMLILPSIAEPFGMVALEAAQAGLAVMLSDRCGAKEILKSASVINHRDVDAWVRAIVYLIENPVSYRKLVRQLQKEAASRTWRDAAEDVLAIYAEVLV